MPAIAEGNEESQVFTRITTPEAYKFNSRAK
jgi:hypothetical protein